MGLDRCPLCRGSRLADYRRVGREYLGQHYELPLVKCGACGFVALRQEPDIKYDTDYLRHELVLTVHDPLIELKARERVTAISAEVPPSSAVRFLDIGIGDGRLLHHAEEAGYCTYGLDINERGVQEARQNFGLKATMSLARLDESFPGIEFDVVHMSEVIEHLRDPLAMLTIIRQRLKPDGCFVVQTGNISSLAARLSGRKWEYIRPMHVSYFSTKTLKLALTKAGFRVRRVSTTDWRWSSVLRQAKGFIQAGRPDLARTLMLLHITTRLHGVRRTVLAYARLA